MFASHPLGQLQRLTWPLLTGFACLLGSTNAAGQASAPIRHLSHTSHGAVPLAPTLCSADEETYFSCPISRGRLISVCGSKGKAADELLQYKVGTLAGSPELVYPDRPAAAKGRFEFVDPTLAKARLLNLRFKVAGTAYVVYRYSGAFAESAAGVASRVVNASWRYTPCQSGFDQPKFESIRHFDIDVDADFDELVFPP
jgi:hypothetical protein